MNPRILIVKTVYHHRFNSQPTAYECRACINLLANDRPDSYDLEATEEWQPLDLSRLKQVGTLVIANEEGKNRQVVPTEDELELSRSRVIEIGIVINSEEIVIPFMLIHPGLIADLTVVDSKKLRIRCRHDRAPVTVTAITA